ncbi:hypothetical protein GCM10009636_16380 [Arthrobacter koreensis]
MKLRSVKHRAQSNLGSLRQRDPDLEPVRLDFQDQVLHVFAADFAGGNPADSCGTVVGVDYGLTYVKRQCVYLWLRRILTRYPPLRARWTGSLRGTPSHYRPRRRSGGSAEAVPAHG